MLRSLTHTTAGHTCQPGSCRSESTRKAAVWTPSLQELLGLIKKTNPFFHFFFFYQYTLKGFAVLSAAKTGWKMSAVHEEPCQQGLGWCFHLGEHPGMVWVQARVEFWGGWALFEVLCWYFISPFFFFRWKWRYWEGFESLGLDAFCRHTGLMEVARGLAGLQESLSDCKEPQEGTVLSVFF